MTGKIDGSLAAQMAASTQATSQARGGNASAGRVESVREVDSVTLSSQSSNLNQLVDVARAAPDVDMQKVTAIRESLAAGTYTVDAESIATKMAHMEWQMGGRD